MFWITKNRNVTTKILSASETTEIAYERLTLDTKSWGLITMRQHNDLRQHNDFFDVDFLNMFNKGNSIYRSSEPFASFVSDSHDACKKNYSGEIQVLEKWPEEFEARNLFLKNKETNEMLNVFNRFGPYARSKIDFNDVNNWILFWSILDLIEDVGAYNVRFDSRIPERESFLVDYRPSMHSYEKNASFSKEELRIEIRRSLEKQYGIISSVKKKIEDWVSSHPHSLYSTSFEGRYLSIYRHSDIQTALSAAERENHPLFDRLKNLGNF